MKTIKQIVIFGVLSLASVTFSCKKDKEEKKDEVIISDYYITGTLAPDHVPFIISIGKDQKLNFSSGFTPNGINNYTWKNNVLAFSDYSIEIGTDGAVKNASAIFENPILVKTPETNVFSGKTFGRSNANSTVGSAIYWRFHAKDLTLVTATAISDLDRATNTTAYLPINTASFYIQTTSGYVFGVLLNNSLKYSIRDTRGSITISSLSPL